MANKKIAGVVVEEQDGERRIRVWAPLFGNPNQERPPTGVQQRTIAILAVAVAGLVILLVFRVAPSLGALLVRFLTALF